MQQSANPLYWSFSIGRLCSTRIFISYFLPLLLISFLIRFGWVTGLTISAVLLLSVLAHELFGHVLICRMTGGYGEEVLLWPLGGLAFVQPEPHFMSRFLTAAGGPFINAVICLVFLPTVYLSGQFSSVMNPMTIPSFEESASYIEYLILMFFAINLLLLIVNLLPVFPLDGGQILETFLLEHTDHKTARQTSVQVGMVATVLISIIGWLLDSAAILAFLAMPLLVMNMWEYFRLQMPDSIEESFMGYDFSQGYTSLEKSYQTKSKVHKSWLQQRREKNEERKRLKLAQQQRDLQLRLDELLQKVSRVGMEQLTATEKKELIRASAFVKKDHQSRSK